MRILVATHYFESHRGGVEIVAGQIAREFVRRDVAVVWLAADASPPPESGCGAAVPLPANNGIERRWGLPLPLPALAALRPIWRAVGEADVVLLHDGLYPTNVAVFLAARLRVRPVIVIQHIGAVPYRSRLLRWTMALANAWIVRPILRKADQVVFIGDTTAAYFAQVRFCRAPRTIYNGVDGSVFRARGRDIDAPAVRRRLGLPAAASLVLFVGRFVEKKGLPVMERLARSMPHVTFVFAGWGPLDPDAWGLRNVRVLRSLAGPELAELYRASDLFVLPSIGEGLPLVLQEALACGIPALCGADTAHADPVLEALVTALPVDPHDPAATAEIFRAAIADGLARGHDPEAAEVRARACSARYSWPAAAAAHLALIEAVLRERTQDARAPLRIARPR